MKTYLYNFTVKPLTKLYSFIITPLVNQKTLPPRLRYSFFFSASFLLASLFLLIACVETKAEPDENNEALITSLELSIADQDYPVTFDDNGAASVSISSPLTSFPSELTIKSISLSDGATVKDQDGNAVTVGSTVAIATDGDKRSITLTVTAKDRSTTRDYTISLIPLNTDANIDTLTLEIAGNEYTVPTFDDTGNASITVSASISNPPTRATVKNMAISSGATANQNDNTIADGNTVFITDDAGARSIALSITSEDGTTTRDYTITINITNSDAKIDSLTLVIGGTEYVVVAFDANDNAEVKFESTDGTIPTSLTIKTLVLSANATAKDQGGNAINTGTDVTTPSTVNFDTDADNNRSIPITVTAEDGSTRTYTINFDVVSAAAKIDSLVLTINSADYTVAAFDTSDTATVNVPIANPAVTIPSSVTVKTITLPAGVSAADSAGTAVANGTSVDLVAGEGRQRILTLDITDASNSTRTYTVLVQFVNKEAKIDSLTITVDQTDFPITFDADNKATIQRQKPPWSDPPTAGTVKSIVLSDGATAKDGEDKLLADNDTFSITNEAGKTEATFTVTAEDGTTKTEYIITVGHRAPVTISFVTAADINYIAFNPDGSKLATSTSGGNFHIFDGEVTADTSTTIFSFSYKEDGYRSPSFSPDETKLVAALLNDIIIWDVSKIDDTPPIAPNEITKLTADSRVNAVVFSLDGLRLVSGGYNFTIQMWDASKLDDATPTAPLIATLSGHGSHVRSLALHPDKSKIASGSLDNDIRIWDATVDKDSTDSLVTLTADDDNGHSADITSLAFNSDGSKLVSGGVGSDTTGGFPIKIWNTSTLGDATPTASLIATLTGHTENVTSVVFSPDDSKIISGSYDDTIKIWDANDTGNISVPIATLAGHSDNVNVVTFSPDGTRLASSSNINDNTIKIWR